MSNSAKPIARKEGLVIQELNDEVLVYDLETNKAHCLNESAATVWKNCDGAQTISEIAKQFIEKSGNKVNEDFVWFAIDQLNEINLLEKELKPDFKGQSRREVLRKIGLASIVALPIVASLIAPTSVLASSSCSCANPAACLAQTGCPATCSVPGVCVAPLGPDDPGFQIQIERPKNAR